MVRVKKLSQLTICDYKKAIVEAKVGELQGTLFRVTRKKRQFAAKHCEWKKN